MQHSKRWGLGGYGYQMVNKDKAGVLQISHHYSNYLTECIGLLEETQNKDCPSNETTSELDSLLDITQPSD